ncbi:MAG: hypothetical protein JRG85_18515 [Deltaproteobacteria bacterium]|nr:hypothetical protein [Deltaproteobacteria bacterium]
MSLRRIAPALATTLILSACGAAPQIESCEAADGVTPVCGFESPEDLVTLPGDAWLAVSQMRRGDAGGNLIAWRVSDGERVELWPGGALAPAAGWGDAYCPGSSSWAWPAVARRSGGAAAPWSLRIPGPTTWPPCPTATAS